MNKYDQDYCQRYTDDLCTEVYSRYQVLEEISMYRKLSIKLCKVFVYFVIKRTIVSFYIRCTYNISITLRLVLPKIVT